MAKKKKNFLNSVTVRFIIYATILLPLIFMRELAPVCERQLMDTANETMNTGHVWCAVSGGEFFTEYPPLYLWIMMLTERLLGDAAPMALGLLSLIPALVILGVFDTWCKRELKSRYARGAELALFTTAGFLCASVMIGADMLMCMFIVLALRMFWAICKEKHTNTEKWLFGIFVFLAMFTKGPVGFLAPLVCTVVYLLIEKNPGVMRKVWGWRTWAVILSGCALWWTCAAIEGGTGYLKDMLLHQTFGRVFNSFAYSEPVYYYLYSIWYAMGPWAIFTVPVIVWALIKKTHIGDITRFFLICSGSFLVMMSLFSCKRAIYLLPCFGMITYSAFMILYRMKMTNHTQHTVAKTLRLIMTVGSGIVILLTAGVSIVATEWLDEILLQF